jgi:hypothetical protein
LYNDDSYIDNLYNTDEIAINSLIKGTSVTDEIINFYRKANSSYDFDLWKAIGIQLGDPDSGVVGQSGQYLWYYTPYKSQIQCNYDLGPADEGLDEILDSVTLRVNNVNLYEGGAPSSEYTGNGTISRFKNHVVLEDDDGMQGAAGYYRYAPVLNTTARLGYVQENTKNYLKYLGIADPENLLDDLPYTTSTGAPDGATYSDIIDSVFLNFRVKFVSGVASTTGNRISNKYLWLFAKAIYGLNSMPHSLTYTTDDDGVDTVHLLKYEVVGDGSNYSLGISHVTTSTGNSSHADYQYDRDLISEDGYYYYDANKTLPVGDNTAQTVSQVQSYLNNSSIGTSEVKANWLEIEENSVTVTVNGVASVFPDEIYLVGSGITLKIHNSANNTYVEAEDQVLRVGNLYIKKSSSEIVFATVPPAVYSNASVTYGKSNATSVTYYTVHNVSSIERITDWANDYSDSNFRYISHKLDASNNCVSAPIMMGPLQGLNPFEQHQLIIASANLSLHMAYYLRIQPTWEQKLRAATLNAIKIGAIIYSVITLGSASSLVVLAESAIVAYATSLAINAIIEHILVPVIISNFGEDEALILLAVAAVAIAIYSSKGGTAGLNQFPNQVTLFTTSVDIMNQMYTLAVVQPGIIEMQKEQEKWTETDSELTEEEEALQEEMDALFGTEDSPSALLNLQTRAALNPMPASAYTGYHDSILERQFDCFEYGKYNELSVS